MRDWQGKRYWIVGASEGLGRALSVRLAKAGASLVLSARSPDRLAELADEIGANATVVPLDIRDSADVARAAAAIGPIDGLIHLAGTYWPVPATAWDSEKVETMLDVNLTGMARVIGAVLPAMIDRGAGHIVLTGSLAAFVGLPGAVGYAASKAGVLSLGETMRSDLKGTGVTVQVSNPGYIRTRLTDLNDFPMPFIMDPEQAAERMFRHISGNRFCVSYPTAFSLVFRGARLLPDSLLRQLF